MIDTNPEASRETLLGWISHEQLQLWHDLQTAIDRAQNRAWSMDAANFARRIVETTLFVPPSEATSLPWSLYAGGVWRSVLEAGRVEDLPPHDEDALDRLDEEMVRLGAGSRADAVERYAATVAAIRTPRETNWIAGGDE